MLMHPQIDPIAIKLGPLAIHWYGLTYLVAFALFFFLATRRLRHEPYASITQPKPWTRQDIEDLLFWGVLGVIAGGRIGYCLFYKPAYYAAHPLEIFAIWQGGMSGAGRGWRTAGRRRGSREAELAPMSIYKNDGLVSEASFSTMPLRDMGINGCRQSRGIWSRGTPPAPRLPLHDPGPTP